MASILDVVATTRTVKTHKFGELEVAGLSLTGIAQIISDHPELIEIFQGDKKSLELKDIIGMGEGITASFLAAGLGHPGNSDVIAKCRTMNAEDAMTVGQAILEESFPGGAANFFNRVMQAASAAQVLVQVKPSVPDLSEAGKTS